MDDIDLAPQHIEQEQELRLKAAQAKAAIPIGAPGDCEMCGEWSGRLIVGVCSPCRDKFRLE